MAAEVRSDVKLLSLTCVYSIGSGMKREENTQRENSSNHGIQANKGCSQPEKFMKDRTQPKREFKANSKTYQNERSSACIYDRRESLMKTSRKLKNISKRALPKMQKCSYMNA
jgi:hypothetical protein